jgi:bla regulator protein BlaR1
MKFPAINSLLTDQLIKALCNTLVHSLWQGIILAAVAGLIIIGTKRASSALRYNLLIAALVLFAAGTVVTFVTQFHLPVYSGPNQQVNVVNQNPVIIRPFSNHVIVQSGTLADVISRYVNAYHNPIVLVWFLIICAKSIQLGVGLYGTYQLKRVNVIGVKGFWNERMKQLACLLGIKQGITMLESGLAKVPMVIGHLKPVILIPIGLLAALSAEEVEAILVHELAHIKRRDYLVNMLQSLMEIVFFFNPAVLWISQLIKTERENCCDDMALAQSTNKVNYIRALISCEEYQAAVPAYAMAFPGSKNSLLYRVKRLASNSNHSLNGFEKTLLAICLVVSGLCVSAFAEKDNIKRTVKNVVKIFQPDDEQKQKLAGQTALLQQQTSKIRANTAFLSVNQPRLKVVNDTNQSKLNVLTGPLNLTTNVALSPMNVSLGALTGSMGPLGGLDTTRKKIKKVVVNDSVNVNVNTNVSTNVTANVNTAYSNTYSTGYGLSTNSKRNSNSTSNYQPQGGYKNNDYSTRPDIQRAKARELAAQGAIIADLLKDRLITDGNHISYTLSDKEFILNGEKQSDEIFNKYKKKYMPENPGDNWTWSHTYNHDDKPE